MILQALYDYYDRSGNAGNAQLAPLGWIQKPVDFVVCIDSAGTMVQIESRQDVVKGKRKPGPPVRLPNIGKQSMKHTNSGTDANLLWDNAAFALGAGNGNQRKLGSFIKAIEDWLPDVSDEGLNALRHFLTYLHRSSSELKRILATHEDQEAILTGSPIITFRLHSDPPGQLICWRPKLVEAFESARSSSGHTPRGQCLITGKRDVPIATNETVIKGVWRTQPSGANLISFNERAFESYGKTKRQGENAPVSSDASFAYTTALNHLLREGSRNRFQVGDASTVCWAERDTEFDPVLAEIFGQHDNPDEGVRAVAMLFEAFKSGRFDGTEGETLYYVLGLAPNAARISVRFFHRLKIRDLAPRILQHFTDLQLAHGPKEPDHPSLYLLLSACAAPGKTDNIPPNLGGAVIDAILAGPDAPYPSLWLNAAINRCRAERKVGYLRAAAIKACLNRSIRRNSKEKEFHPMLDLDNTNAAYRLGRLFAVLEKIQEEASPGLNATIRDRYYGAASSTPVAVFTTLLRLKNAHLKKLSPGRSVNFEKLLGEVLSCVTDFPAHLSLADQGRFALGYYHQRQAFFTKSDKTESNEEKQ